MKVILIKDVEKLGEKWDVVNVSDGHGRNFLIPRGLAMPATTKALAQNEKRLAKREEEKSKQKEAAQQLADQLTKLEIKIAAEAGEEGKLFGSITSQQIVDKIRELGGLEIDKKKIHLEHHIKNVGKHKVSIKLFPEVVAELTIQVEAQ